MLSVLLCFLTALADDVIVTTSGTTIDAKVVEISDTDVKYKKASNPDGPTYSMKIASVARIDYDNGTSDIFNTSATSYTPDPTPSSVLTDITGDVSDTELMLRYAAIDKINRQVRNIRVAGYTLGGACIAAGIIIAAIGLTAEGFTGDQSAYHLIGGGGGILLGGGVIAGTYFLSKSKQKKIDRMQWSSASIYQHKLIESGSSILSMDLNTMQNHCGQHALGLGLTLKF